MAAMIRKIRRHLWLVSYHSAARNRSVWTRWIERSLFAAVVLAVPATLAMESLVTRVTAAESVSGRLAETEDGLLIAAFEDALTARFRDGLPVGDWTLSTVRSERGWPFPSLRAEVPPRLDLNRYDQADLEIGAQLEAEDPLRVAIQQALAVNRPDLAEAWRVGRTTELRRYWRGTIAGGLAWWVGLSLASVIVIRLLALRSLLRRARRADEQSSRAAEGRCPGCDYDLRGLEFSARCPECGKLL